MKVSFITTIFNEGGTIERFLDSIYSQTQLPDEVVIVDGGSTDSTVELIKHYESRIKSRKVKFHLVIKKGNRSIGRNEAIRHASGDIIVCSDSGNILDKEWVKNITQPFKIKNKNIDVVAGYYEGIATTVFQKCVIPYALVMPDRADPDNFLPATRSVAFTKAIWKKVGGFNNKLSHNEDYVFAKALQKAKAHIVFKKDAIVYWLPRNTLKQTYTMLFRFAYGDAEARIWRPKVILVFLRYLFALVLLICFFIFKLNLLEAILLFLFIFYIVWSIRKNYRYVRDIRAIFWLPILQFTADLAVIVGTSLGFVKANIW